MHLHVIFISDAGTSAEQKVTVQHAAVSTMSNMTSEMEIQGDNAITETELSVQQVGGHTYDISTAPVVISSETLETVSDTSSETVIIENNQPSVSSRSEVETYDEITKSEVTSLDDWENVQESCLSEIPPVDPEVLGDLELRANDIAGNLDHMLITLANSLKAMSHVSSECLGVYSSCVDHVSETVDVNIKSMYTLIARCEELNASLKPVQNMAEQVKEIKKTLDIFEAICK